MLYSAEEVEYKIEIMQKSIQNPKTILLISLAALAANIFLPEMKPPPLFLHEDTDN